MLPLQPRQFVQNQLFARPSELRSEGIEFGDGDGERIKPRKLAEARDSGLYEAIAADGVRKPVEVFPGRGRTPWLTNGHHRFFSAEEQGDRWLPLEYVGAGKQKRMWKELDSKPSP
jgi:hypothetical protein